MNTLEIHEDAGVATVTLNRPASMNALSGEMVQELSEVLRDLRLDPAARVLVLTGAGGNFCAGGDVRQMGSAERSSVEGNRSGIERARRVVNELHSMDKPVIAAIDGVAFGGGLGLALLADMILVSDRARLSVVFHRIGLIPDFGTFHTLPRIVGLQRAKELIFSAREFGPEEARQFGIAMEVVPPERLQDRTSAVARSLTTASPLAVSISKRALQSTFQSDMSAALDIEAIAQPLAQGSDYARESMRRFAAKEPPQFTWSAL